MSNISSASTSKTNHSNDASNRPNSHDQDSWRQRGSRCWRRKVIACLRTSTQVAAVTIITSCSNSPIVLDCSPSLAVLFRTGNSKPIKDLMQMEWTPQEMAQLIDGAQAQLNCEYSDRHSKDEKSSFSFLKPSPE